MPPLPAAAARDLLKPRFTQPDASKPYFELYGTAKPVIVLVHGYMANRLMYNPLLPELLNDFSLLTIDNRGFGNSKDLVGPYSIEQMGEDVVGVLDDLHLDEVHIVGYSKGGLITQYLAHHHRHRIQKMVLAVTFSFKMLTPLERMQRQFLPTVIKRLGAKGMARVMYDGIAGGVNMSLSDFTAFKRQLADCRDDVLLQTGHSLFKFDSREWLAGITTPTLVVGGTDDIVVPIHHPRFLAANIPGAQIKVIERAGHGMVYTHTERLAGFIRNFLNAAT